MKYYCKIIIWMEKESLKFRYSFFYFSGNLGMSFSFFMHVGFADILRQNSVLLQSFLAWFLDFFAQLHFSIFPRRFIWDFFIFFARCSDHELTHWSIIQEYLAASACFHEIVNKLYVFCFSAATHERINVTCFEREVPCLYIVWISRTFVGSKIHNNPFCKSDIFFAHHYKILLYTCCCIALVFSFCSQVLKRIEIRSVDY